MDMKGASTLHLITLVICVAAFVMNFVCVFIPNWVNGIIVGRNVYFGVWQYCQVEPGIGSISSRYTCSSVETQDLISAVQAMMAIGLITSVVGAILHLLYMIKASCKTRLVAICGCVANLVTAVSSLIGISIFTSKNKQGHNFKGYLWYSHAFYFEWIAILFYVVSVIFNFLYLRKRKSSNPSNRPA